MDRALDLGLLAAALDGQDRLPSAAELQQLLAEAEVQLFLRGTAIPPELLETAWFLHGIASVDGAHQIYTVSRQRQAFTVSAHIFDLALTETHWSPTDRLVLAFAAAIGYRRGDLDPNATAIVQRANTDIATDAQAPAQLPTLALQAGVALLGFQTRRLFGAFRRWLAQLRELSGLAQLDDLTTTAFGTTHAVVRGADHLLHFLARGDRVRLARARDDLTRAALGQAGPGEHLARWVAAHLLALSGEADAGSVFTLLPPDLPDTARHAFTVAHPPVLTLWRPQRELLGGERSPLDADTKRMVLSLPTSGGKTLLAQLLMVAHLARQSSSVCYIAPTRSLCREVRRAMAGRVRILQKEIGHEAPDFPQPGDLLRMWAEGAATPPDVEVMTPERLAHLIRHDPQAVLDRFGLFIFDEAQLIQEDGRGFTLESLISYLHYRTQHTHHRLVLISAAMGNQGQIMAWIDPAGGGLLHHSDWRGPRRLHAVFSTVADFRNETITPSKSKTHPYRMTYPLHGRVRLRPADDRPERRLHTTEPIGQLTLKATRPDERAGRSKDTERSTRQYVLAAAMITLLGHAGSVLVVAGQRVSAERLARQLAEALPRNPGTVALADFARLQLGSEHPLVATLRHGVGFHHAGLPTEVLEAMEEALREDQLPYLTCTSTLTDGVNLPVRTVVLYDETYPPEARLSGARLVNAMGRAGRAGKESEGWIVLIRAAKPEASDFDDLRPTPDELTTTSTMATENALTAIAALEQASRERDDAVFTAPIGSAADFVAFVWFALAANEQTSIPAEETDLGELLNATLAGQQLRPDARARLVSTAGAVRAIYLRTDPDVRRRWARTGTSIGSARRLDEFADQVVDRLLGMGITELDAFADPLPVIDLLADAGVLRSLLTLPENSSRWLFRTKPRGTVLVEVDPRVMLCSWVGGTSLNQLADDLLAEVPDPAWRIAQLVDAVTAHFEHFLAWTVGALIQLINESLTERGLLIPICPELPGYIRYGVHDPRALALMLAGVRSRRLAHAVAEHLPEAIQTPDVADWLGDMTLTAWRDRFHASPSEVLDLLAVTRTPRGSLLRPLLETGTTSLKVRLTRPDEDPAGSIGERGPVTVKPAVDQPEPAAIELYSGTVLVGEIPPSSHSDVAAILDTGLDTAAELDRTTNPPTLTVTLLTDDAEPA